LKSKVPFVRVNSDVDRSVIASARRIVPPTPLMPIGKTKDWPFDVLVCVLVDWNKSVGVVLTAIVMVEDKVQFPYMVHVPDPVCVHVPLYPVKSTFFAPVPPARKVSGYVPP